MPVARLRAYVPDLYLYFLLASPIDAPREQRTERRRRSNKASRPAESRSYRYSFSSRRPSPEMEEP